MKRTAMLRFHRILVNDHKILVFDSWIHGWLYGHNHSLFPNEAVNLNEF